jgi:hypothetical protein
VRDEFDAQVLTDGGAGAVPVRRAVPPANLGVGARRARRRPARRRRPPLARPTAAAASHRDRPQSRRPQKCRRGGQYSEQQQKHPTPRTAKSISFSHLHVISAPCMQEQVTFTPYPRCHFSYKLKSSSNFHMPFFTQ